MCAFVAAWVLCHRVPESDLAVILAQYEEAELAETAHEYAVTQGKEPVFYLYMFWCSRIGLSQKAFVFLSAFIIYLSILGAIVAVAKRAQLNAQSVILAMAITFLFPPLFNISTHLLRQMLAAGIVITAFAQHGSSARKRVLILILSTLVHTSASIFLVWEFVRGVWIKESVVMSGIAGILLYGAIDALGTLVLSYVSGLGGVYLLVRATENVHVDFTPGYAFPIFMLAFSVLVIRAENRIAVTSAALERRRLFPTFFFLIAFFFGSIYWGQIARISYYSYAFIGPIIASYLTTVVGAKKYAIAIIAIEMVIIARGFFFGAWKYEF